MGVWGRGQERPVSAHLVEDHLPVLRVARGQEHLLALLIDLLDARSQVWGERTPGKTQVPRAAQLALVLGFRGASTPSSQVPRRGRGSPAE